MNIEVPMNNKNYYALITTVSASQQMGHRFKMYYIDKKRI